MVTLTAAVARGLRFFEITGRKRLLLVVPRGF